MVTDRFWHRFGRERTRSWQEFLNRTPVEAGASPLYAGPLDGKGSDQLSEATKRFQATAGIPQSGIVDVATTHVALRMPQWTRAWISPRTYEPDLLHLRPYFVVPLDDTAFPGEVEFVADQIRKRFAESSAAALETAEGDGRITDVYVMSHGWHRNFFGGVAAYDRLVSRMSVLLSRGNIQPPTPFNPLFVGLHWHSDPGENGWVDEAGRRSKSSFMRLIRDLFTWEGTELTEADFILDFEDVFEFMSTASAPDVRTLDPDQKTRSFYLAKRMVGYRLRGRRSAAAHDEMISSAWRCYVESEIMRPLGNQSQEPRASGTVLDSLQMLGQFAVGVLGLGAVVGAVVGLFKGASSKGPSAVSNLVSFLRDQPWTRPWEHHEVLDMGQAVHRAGIAGMVVAGAIAFLGFSVWMRNRRGTEQVQARGVPLLQIASYVVLQLATAIPLLYFIVLTFIFRNWLCLLAPVLLVLGYVPAGMVLFVFCGLWSVLAARRNLALIGVFSERSGDWSVNPARLRDGMASLARWPINWLRASLGPFHPVVAMVKGVENQLAFYEMQRKGAAAGDSAGAFLEQLVQTLDDEAEDRPAEDPVRVHLIGHSFGGLVVCNAARVLAKAKIFAKCPRFELRSLCFAQGALGSAWFEHEKETVAEVRGALACIYSRYDSANGFFYPAANQNRLAAGFLGMSNVKNAYGPPVTLGKDGQFAMLARPPKIAGATAIATGQRKPPYLLNLDASRIVYDGSVSIGGGHGDVFKDDVVNLIWAATRL